MIYREYGKTGKELSIVGFGGMRFKDINNMDKCAAMLMEAAQSGINYFDTAPQYFGIKSEKVFGQAFLEFKKRGIPFYASTKTFEATEKGIRTEIEKQLKRLNLDVIDFYHVWCITNLNNWYERKSKGVCETLIKLKEEGLIRHICVSSHLIGDQIKELLAEELFEGVLFGYSAYNFSIRRKAFDTITAKKLGCVVMNPLGGGIIPQNPDIFSFVKTRENETVIEAALHFIFAHKQITTALVGFGAIEEVTEAVRAVDSFTGIQKKEIERIENSISDSFSDLCTGCQYCDNCPENIPIPKFMDAYNHKKLYGNNKAALDRLRWHWQIPAKEAEKCIECGQCEEACTQHLHIIKCLKEITEMSYS